MNSCRRRSSPSRRPVEAGVDRRRAGPGRGLLVAGALCATLAAAIFLVAVPWPAGQAPRSGKTEALDEYRKMLRAVQRELRVLERETDPDVEQRVALGLSRLGRKACAPIIALLCGSEPVAEPAADESPDGRPPEEAPPAVDPVVPEHDPAAQPLIDTRVRRVLCAALSRMPSRSVLDALAPHLEASGDLASRIVALDVLSAVRDVRSLDAWLAVVEAERGPTLQAHRFREASSRSLIEILRTTPGALERLSQRIERASPDVAGLAIEAALRASDPRAIELALGHLGRDAELDAAIARALAELEHARYLASDPSSLRELLASPDAALRAHAAAALGKLNDLDAHREVIALLDDAHPSVAAAAQRALVAMLRRDLGRDAEAWTSWFQLELDWWSEHAQRLSDALASDETGAASAAIVDALAHPLLRHELAPLVGIALDDPNEALALAACEALATLESFAAIEPLVRALDHPSEVVRERALVILRAWTERTLDGASDRWRDALAL